MTRVIRIGGAAIILVALATLLVSSIRLLVADFLARGRTVDMRDTAVRLFPGSVDYILAAADLIRQNGGDIRQTLSDATLADPLNARLYIQLGLECERQGDQRAAVANLLEAARLSNEFLPRWSLANYYFRRNDTAQFLYWSRLALQVGTVDVRPVFNLLWHSGADASQIRTAIPDTMAIRLDYFDWLVGEGMLDEARPYAVSALEGAPEKAADELVSYSARLADGTPAQREEAAGLWNQLCSRGVLKLQKVYPARSPQIQDQSFDQYADGLAFGWRLPTPSIHAYQQAGVLSFDFDGEEPEKCDLLSQIIPVPPRRNYQIKCDYVSSGLPDNSGLAWRVENAQTHVLLSGPPQFLSDSGANVTVPFTVPANCGAVVVVLGYARQEGTVRITGSLRLRSVRLGR